MQSKRRSYHRYCSKRALAETLLFDLIEHLLQVEHGSCHKMVASIDIHADNAASLLPKSSLLVGRKKPGGLPNELKLCSALCV